MNYIVLLAGGVGSRFWPMSRETEPKQFLSISSQRPMLEDAVRRLGTLVEPSRIIIATSKRHQRKVRECTRALGFSSRNFLFESKVRNTLGPIAYLADRINRVDPQGVIAVVPCDHFVRSERVFRATVKRAMRIAAEGSIVTFGFPPRRPETGYGYIKVKGKPAGGYLKVDRFVEKPSLLKAQEYLRDKRYYWNGGVFVFRADVMAGEVRTYVPEAAALIERMDTASARDRLWPQLPSTSIDYAVMERTRRCVVVPVDYGWLDLGSWQAVMEVSKRDKNGNVIKGRVIDVASRNTLVWAEHRLVATAGLRDVIIVDTKDALLVCAKDHTQDVKTIVTEMKKRKLLTYA